MKFTGTTYAYLKRKLYMERSWKVPNALFRELERYFGVKVWRCNLNVLIFSSATLVGGRMRNRCTEKRFHIFFLRLFWIGMTSDNLSMPVISKINVKLIFQNIKPMSCIIGTTCEFNFAIFNSLLHS